MPTPIIRLTVAVRSADGWSGESIAETHVDFPIVGDDRSADVAEAVGHEADRLAGGLLDSPIVAKRIAAILAKPADGF